MINLAVLSEALNKIDYTSILKSGFIPFVILAFLITGSWNTIKFCLNMIRNQ